MSQPPYQDIAKEFIDLWQKQMSSVMGDKQFIHAMLEMFQAMQKPSATNHGNTNATNPSDASVAQHGLLSELAFRLAMCEKRIASLESQLAAKPAAKPAKRSAKTGHPK